MAHLIWMKYDHCKVQLVYKMLFKYYPALQTRQQPTVLLNYFDIQRLIARIGGRKKTQWMQFGTTEVKREKVRRCMHMNMHLCAWMCLYSHLHYALIVHLLVWHQVLLTPDDLIQMERDQNRKNKQKKPLCWGLAALKRGLLKNKNDNKRANTLTLHSLWFRFRTVKLQWVLFPTGKKN